MCTADKPNGTDMDKVKKEADAIFALPVALALQNTTNVDNAIDAAAAAAAAAATATNATAGRVLVESVSGDNAFAVSGVDKMADVIRRELKWGFILHTYGFGCLFFILAFYTFFSILNLRSFISSRPFMSTINGFLCLLGASRAASLFIDAYNLRETMPKVIGQILWDLGFPSIISAFCLVQLAFLQLTQLKIGPEGLRRKSCLSLVVAAHFMLTIGVDIIVASHENLLIAKYVIQYVFLTWGVVLCCSFLYSGYKVMSMIKNIPGGFKQRDLPDPNHKGIMQLAMLAPHNNLAGSVTAALLPTLCAPKIHQQDNTSTSTMGFRNEGNSRILESESIPMLEEMTASSGDERSPQPLTRGSSFQNQTRNTQKFNLKPKLSLRSCPEGEQTEEKAEKVVAVAGVASPKGSKSLPPKSPPSRFPSPRGSRFDLPAKSNNGILKNAEPFVTTKDVHEFKTKIPSRGNVEGEKGRKPGSHADTCETLIPDILISSASRSNSAEVVAKKAADAGEADADAASASDDAPRHASPTAGDDDDDDDDDAGKKEGRVHLSPESRGKSSRQRSDSEKRGRNSRRSSDSSRRGSQMSESGSRRNSYRRDSSKESNFLSIDIYSNRRSSDSSALSEIEECSDEPLSPGARDRRKNKSITWKKKKGEEERGSRESATRECLLPQESTTTDVSLSAILNHIAYVNRAALTADTATQEELEKVRKSKVEWVLNVTYITAMWGLMLCLSNMGRIYNPNGVPEPRFVHLSSPATNSSHAERDASGVVPQARYDGILSSPWPWLWFQTFCRALELAMGCAMANITRQPTATYRNPHALSLRHRDTLYNI